MSLDDETPAGPSPEPVPRETASAVDSETFERPADAPCGQDHGRRKSETLSGPVRLLLPIALAAGIIFSMKYASSVVAPIFLALFLTMGMSPALYWLRKKGLSPGLCILIVSIVMAGALILFLLIMLGAVAQLDEKLPVYQENLESMAATAEAWFAERGIDITALTEGALAPEDILGWVSGLLGVLLDLLGNIFWLILIVLFMVAQVYAIPNRMIQSSSLSPTFAKSFENFSSVTRTFLFTKGWLSFIVAVIVGFIYYIFGTDFALVWALLFFVLSFIPNIGFILSVIPPFFITLLEFGFGRAALVTIIVIVINTIVDNGLSPKIMGRSVGLSSLAVFLSVFIWGWVLGGVGALMSVPLMLMVKLLFFDSFESTRPISELISTPIRELGKPRKGKKGKGGPEEPADASA